MKKIGRYFTTKARIMLSALIPMILIFALLSILSFSSLYSSLNNTAKAEFMRLTQEYASGFEKRIIEATDYLSIVSSTIELNVAKGGTSRESLQETVFNAFENYGSIDGSSIFFEPNMFDGRDEEYKGTKYGTARSGRISYFFCRVNGKTVFVTEALGYDSEFLQPYYTNAKETNKPIFSVTDTYEVDGIKMPMLTISYPIKDTGGAFIGAVTVNIFLEEMYARLQKEDIYETGYLAIACDTEELIYGPRFEYIGETRENANFIYPLPKGEETTTVINANSVLTGKETLVVIETIYIEPLDSRFYVSAAAPLEEIYADATGLVTVLLLSSVTVLVLVGLLQYYFIQKIYAPINEITKSVDRIANGEYSARIHGDFSGELAVVKDSVNVMADNIETYIKEAYDSINTLQSIMNGMEAFIYVTDPKTDKILFANKQIKSHFNMGDGEGRHCYEVLQLGYSERCDFCPCYQLDLEPDKAIVWEEYNPLTKRYYRNLDCYIDWLGGIKAHLQHAVDITDMKIFMEEKLEAERMALDMKLEKEKAEATAQAKNVFLARMSHEIRTPMNAVMGMTELILRKGVPPEIFENALTIKSAGENLLSVINDVLDYSKIESGMLEIVEGDYMLSSLINDVISIIRIRLLEKPIHFTVYVDPSIPAVLFGDEIRIRQALINILGNAAKYTSEGFISLSVTGSVFGDEIVLTMSVSDSGIGIKEGDIDKLFGDFVQIDSLNNKGIEGTGLGLAISRSLCRAMGGDITVESEYGVGSTFSITLPQKFLPGAPFASVEEPSGKSVLLYESRQTHRASIEKSLNSLGVAYYSVENIPSLFENINKYTYVFVSSFAYASVEPMLSRIENPPRFVLLSDVSETTASPDARLLRLPAHTLSIARVLNDVREDCSEMYITGVSFIAPDARILVVDDIAANLMVTEGLLQPYEMRVTLCSSGREALELLTQTEFDLVFMDHMMPEMDGLEATQHIREMEGEYYQSLPIIALTANAVSGVREMFIQNGMDDFLAKPIETVKLNAILEKWIPKEKRRKPEPQDQTEDSSGFIEMLKNVKGLNLSGALAVVGGSVHAYERIAKLSVRLLPGNIERLEELIRSDLAAYAIEVHGLKGVLNSIGAYALGDMAFELEKASKAGDTRKCTVFHPQFIEELKSFEELMSRLIDESSDAQKDPGDISLLYAALPRLEEAVDFYDALLALEVLESFERYTFGKEADKSVKRLMSAFESFDFDEAAEIIEQLKAEGT